jgi:hypothetical protein
LKKILQESLNPDRGLIDLPLLERYLSLWNQVLFEYLFQIQYKLLYFVYELLPQGIIRATIAELEPSEDTL